MSSVWSCPCCTYDNIATVSECIVCGAINYKIVEHNEELYRASQVPQQRQSPPPPPPQYPQPPPTHHHHHPPPPAQHQHQQEQHRDDILESVKQLDAVEARVNEILGEFDVWQKEQERSRSFDLEKYTKKLKVTSELLFQQQLKLDGVVCYENEGIRQRRRDLTKFLVDKVGLLDSLVSGKRCGGHA